MIVEPITEDGLVGFTKSGALLHTTVLPDGTKTRHIHDVRGEICRMCDRGWHPTAASLGDQSKVPYLPGHVHLSCRIRHEGINERRAVYRALCGTVPFDEIVATANRYWPEADPWSKKPWYWCKPNGTELRLLIGMRKKVWHIELVDQGSPSVGLEYYIERAREAFAAEDVTKSFMANTFFVHAWGDADLCRYVKMLADVRGFALK